MMQSEQIVVRRARKNDIEPIVDIAARNCKNPWDYGQLIEELDFSFSFLFLAELDGEVVGFVDMHIAGGEAHINEIAVDGLYRRRGIGDRLMHACITEAMLLDCGTMTLEVREGNAGALALYKSLGFHTVGVRKGFYTNPPDNAVVMKMVLTDWDELGWLD